MTDTLTPAEKSAITRAKNKAARLASAEEVFDTTSTEVDMKTEATGATIMAQLPPVIQTVVAAIDTVGNDTSFQVTASRVTTRFSAKARNIIYTIGIVMGVAGTALGPIVAFLTGDTQLYAASAVAIALGLSNLLAKLNLSKTATDIASDTAKA